MAVMNIIDAVRSALQTQMRADPRVIVLGEDVGKFGGVFRATAGLFDEFGADRVIDTPLAEAGIIGTAIGMAIYGLRPVPEIQFSDFIYPAYDQIVNELAKFRYRSGGQYTAPVVIRTHATDLRVAMPEALKVYKNLYTEAKFNGESLTTYEPRGERQKVHLAMSKLGSKHLINVHILANLEPFRYGTPRFIQKRRLSYIALRRSGLRQLRSGCSRRKA